MRVICLQNMSVIWIIEDRHGYHYYIYFFFLIGGPENGNYYLAQSELEVIRPTAITDPHFLIC